MHTISLICENRTFFIVLFEEFVVHLIKFFSLFSGNQSHEILLKSNLPILSVFTKYFNLSTTNYQVEVESFHTTLYSSLSPLNFQE